MIAPILLLATLQAADAVPANQRLVLPEGPLARALAGVGPRTPPATWESSALPSAGPELWEAWAGWVASEARASAPDPAVRARLALLARRQGRTDDAWSHLAACGADPSWLAAALPAFLPGLSVEHLLATGAAPGGGTPALEDGVRLTPALPPVPRTGIGQGEPRATRIEGLRVGEATLSMEVTVFADGVQVELLHSAGGAGRLEVLLPEPEAFQVRVAYLDWERVEHPDAPIPVLVDAEHAERVLFGRFLARIVPVATTLPAELPAALRRDGLRLEAAPGSPAIESLRGLDRALERLLDVPCSLVAVEDAGSPSDWPGIRVRLGAGAGWQREARALVSRAERFLLGPGAR